MHLSPIRPEVRFTERLTEEEAAVIQAIRETSFGAVEVVLHQARIVQVVRSGKTRFDAP
jgi:hypothetical protein